MRKKRKKNIFNKLTDLTSSKSTSKTTSTTRSSKGSAKKKNSRNTSKTKEKGAKRKVWKKIVTVILILGIIGILLVTMFLGYIVVTAPKFDEKKFSVNDQSVIYDINGEVMATLGSEKRESVTYEELPQVLIDAIVATEDSRYFQHNGVDLPRFLKASVLQLLGRDDAGGASTLTMQTVKNNLTNTNSTGIKGIIRKFQDVYLAVFKVEKQYSKEKIFELYVNNYNLGSNVYGVEEASKYYFGKSVSELTLPEASMIAGLFQAPNRHNPYKNIDSATARRDTVLSLMVRHGYITKEEKELAQSVSIESMLDGTAVSEATAYQGFIDAVVDEIIDKTGDNPYTVSMKVYTTMEKSIQDGINKILSGEEYTWKDDKIQGGIAIVNVETGAIAALGAGRNRTGERTFNYATDARRQPGSTAKPIFAYGPGIENNNFSSYQLFMDEAWSYTNGPNINNWDGGYSGLVTARYALQVSRNVPAVKAFQQVGIKNVQKFAYSLGLDVALNQNSENYRVLNTGVDNTINEAYAIGGVAEGFTPLEMAAAYSGFASGGYYTEPYSVTKIEYRSTGETKEFKPSKTRVMKDSTAYIMNNILESAVEVGFNGGARVYGSHVAAKTGTSNFDTATLEKYNLPSWAVNDLWTVAYTSQYSIAVWYGYENASSEYYNTEGSGKETLTSAVMKYIPKDTKGFTMPSSVVASQVEKETWPAQLPSEYTPSDMITTEYFVKGTQPTEVSDRYAKFSDVTNLKQVSSGNTAVLTWEHSTPKVLTDDYLKQYFSNSVFGNSSTSLLNSRKSYIKDTLGGYGFGIYRVDASGATTLIDFTTEKTYTYTGSGNTTLMVRAEYGKFKANASDGVKINVTLDGTSTNPSTPTSGDITINLDGKASVSTSVKTYRESGIKDIYYGNIDITNSATIKYQLMANGTPELYTSVSQLENAINSKSAGTYTVTYIVNYLNYEATKTRTVILR